MPLRERPAPRKVLAPSNIHVHFCVWVSVSRFEDDHDEVVELPLREHDPGERAIATAVRRSLTEEHWSPQRLRGLAEQAAHRASRRRRQRLLTASATAVAGSAAVAVLLAAGPALVAGLTPDGGRAFPAGPPRKYSEATLAFLSPAEVQAVLPGAKPLSANTVTNDAPEAPRDACGTATLSGVAAPVRTQSGEWGSTSTEQVHDGNAGGTRTTTNIVLYAAVATYPEASAAEAYSAALKASMASCLPRNGQQQPTYPLTFQKFLAPALFTSGYEQGSWNITAVWTQDRYAATVQAWVPASEDQAGREAAAQSVVQLAVEAGTRAAADAGSAG